MPQQLQGFWVCVGKWKIARSRFAPGSASCSIMLYIVSSVLYMHFSVAHIVGVVITL